MAVPFSLLRLILTKALLFPYFFFFFLKGFVPSCIIPLHHGTTMKLAWYVCLKIAGFQGNCFFFPSTAPFVTSIMKRGEGLRPDHRNKMPQKSTPKPLNWAPYNATAQHHKNLQKPPAPLFPPPLQSQPHAMCHNPLRTASFLSASTLGKKPISPSTTGTVVWKDVFKWK